MSLSKALRLVVLWLGWLLSADAVTGLVLGSLTVYRRLGELVLGVLLLRLSTRVLEPRKLLAGVIGWSALAGLLRVARLVLRGLVYHEPHPFTMFAYSWRIVLFLGLGVIFLQMTRKGQVDAVRAA